MRVVEGLRDAAGNVSRHDRSYKLTAQAALEEFGPACPDAIKAAAKSDKQKRLISRRVSFRFTTAKALSIQNFLRLSKTPLLSICRAAIPTISLLP